MHKKPSISSKAAHDKRLFVLDTNVLMHDPTALFRFQEHDIHLPMMVLEELDRAKKGLSEVARNVRQVSRFLDELIASASKEEIDQGLALPALAGERGRPPAAGCTFRPARSPRWRRWPCRAIIPTTISWAWRWRCNRNIPVPG